MRDPAEGLSESGTIRTGADIRRVPGAFRSVHDASVTMIRAREPQASVYAYGSVVTGQARAGFSDVDLLTIGLDPSDAYEIASELSVRFADICRGVEISTTHGSDFVGASDPSYGNRVFLRHYCVLLAGSDAHRPQRDFAGDHRAARGLNGDIARHARRWRSALRAADTEVGLIARRMARKSLLAVAGLVSIHDHTWTTDRESSAGRWGEIAPEHRAGLDALLSWTTQSLHPPVDVVRQVLDGTVEAIVSAFGEQIGLWPDTLRP